MIKNLGQWLEKRSDEKNGDFIMTEEKMDRHGSDELIDLETGDGGKTEDDDAREYAESIINTVREPLIVLSQSLRVVTASRSFYEFFKVNPEETLGQLIYDLGNKQWDIPKLCLLYTSDAADE